MAHIALSCAVKCGLTSKPIANRNRFENYQRPMTVGGMPMSSSLASADFSKGQRGNGPSTERPLHATVRNLLTRARLWLGKVVSSTFARYLIAFFIGVTATLAWQSYGGAARKAVAGWSPHLGWLAPAGAPARPSPRPRPHHARSRRGAAKPRQARQRAQQAPGTGYCR